MKIIRFESAKFLNLFVLSIGLFLFLSACSDDTPEVQLTGIEVGNPSITVSTALSLVYSQSQEQNLAKYSDSYVDRVEITNLKMVVTEVRNHGSDYINIGFDPNQGVVTFSSDDYEAPKEVNFVTGDVPEVLGEMDIETRLLKDIEFSFIAPECVEGVVYGAVNTKPLKVCFDSTNIALDFRFHFSQLDTVAENEFDLDIEFYVENWINGIDLASIADTITADTILIDSNNYQAYMQQLKNSYLKSFNAIVASRFEIDVDGKLDYVSYSNNALARELSGGVGENLIRNSDFSDSLNFWIFFVHDSSIISNSYWSNNTSYIDIHKGGEERYKVQFMQENLILIEGHSYTLKFRAAATRPYNIDARVAMYLPPYRTYNEDWVYELKNEMQDFEVTFVPWQTDFFARFEFNLAEVSDTHVTIESVELYRNN